MFRTESTIDRVCVARGFRPTLLSALLGLSALLAGGALWLSPLSSARADSAAGDSASDVGSYLDFSPLRAGFPAQLDSIARPLTTAMNLIRRDGAEAANVSPTGVVTPSSEAKALLLQSIERADAMKESAPRGLLDEIFLLEGFAFELLGEGSKAVSAYDQSLKLRSLNPLVMFRRGMAHKVANDCPRAIAQFDEVLWASERLAHEVWYAEAQCQLIVGRADLAVALLEKGRKKAPQHAPTSKLLLETRMKAFEASPRSIDNAIAAKMTAELSALADDKPNDSATSLMLAKLLVKKSDPLVAMGDLLRGEKIALQLAEKSAFRDEQSVRLIYDAQIKRGDYKAAEHTLTRGLSANPTSKPLLDASKQLEVYKESGL